MGQTSQKMKGLRQLERVKRTFLGHSVDGHVPTRFRPVLVVLAHASPSLLAHRKGPRMPFWAQNGPKSLKLGPVTPGSGGSLIACRWGTPVPHPTTANCQPKIANCHQPPTANCRQPPTNCQLTTRPDGPKNGQKLQFPKVVPDPWGGSNGPLGPL